MRIMLNLLVALLLVAGPRAAWAGDMPLPPTPMPELEYPGALLDGEYDPAVPTPESILGFPVGQQTATPEQIVEAVQAWSAASDRAVLVEYARSHENRPLYYLMISSPLS